MMNTTTLRAALRRPITCFVGWQQRQAARRLGLNGRYAGAVVVALALGSGAAAQAQQRAAPVLFQEDAAARAAAQASPLAALLRQARPFSLDPALARAALANAPLEGQPGGTPVVLTLPLPDGRTGRFALRETAVLAPALAARYPALKTYSGQGLDDATATLRLDVTPAGLHAQVLSASSSPIYLDPVSLTDNTHYLSYYVAEQRVPGSAGCATPGTAPTAAATLGRPGPTASGPTTAARSAGTRLRVFRLAVATTDEYTAARGGTRASALAAVVTTVNRINGLYERELSVRLQLVSSNELIVAANSSAHPDPYTNNNSTATALTENQNYLDAVIGFNNYDIGHLFGTYGGGYAHINILSQNDKAQAQTGFFNPVGDGFDLQLVAHEMGHQLGAYHTFNSEAMGSCSAANRQGNAACEPGSGSTLMAYPGLCGSDNVQGGRDAYFHTISYEQIQQAIFNVSSSTTGAVTGNVVPSVSVPAGGKTLPMGTPFKLTASATGANQDALTYCWDQLDLGPAASLTDVQVDGQRVPLFRSYSPDSNPTRYFPQLNTLLANASSLTERLPVVDRALVFRCLVRDLHAGPQGITGASITSDSVHLDVTTAAGPFVVTAPNTAVTWAAGSTQTVTWNVAGTTANGVSCATVNLRLSTDGGLTYPVVLLANTPNDGSQTITVPTTPSTTARLMVEAADNYFFDISNQNFTIMPGPGSPPSLSGLSPASGPVGTSFVVNGSNLASPAAVTMGGQRIPFAAASASSLTVVVPDSVASPAAVVVTTSLGTSNGLSFSITPLISSLTPDSGVTVNAVQVGTTVVIAGSGLLNATEVQFNGFLVNNFVVNAAGTALTVTVPGGATTGPVTVRTPGGLATSPTPFTVTERPCTLPGSLLVTSITATTARLSFTASPAAPRFYLATLSPGNRVDTVWAATGFSYTGLTPNTIYTVSVLSYCAPGRTSPTAVLHFATPTTTSNNECVGAVPLVPGAPGESCIPTGSSLTRATQSLPPAQCSGFTASAALDVWFRFDATGPVHTFTVSGNADGVLEVFAGACGSLTSLQCADAAAAGGESLTLTTLTPGATYWARYYYKTSGATYFSACVTTPAPISASCPAPTNVSVSNVTANSASVSFSIPAAGNQYIVSTSPPSTTQTVAAGPVTLSNLRDGTTYVVSVASACPGNTASAPALASFTTEYPDLIISNSDNIALRAYRNITITGTGYGIIDDSGPASRNVVVTGTFRVESGGYFDDNCRLLTGPGNFVLEPAATMEICSAQGISLSGATGTVQVTGSRVFGRNGYYTYDVLSNSPAITGSGLPDTVRSLTLYNTNGPGFTLSSSLAVRNELLLFGVNLYLGSANLTLLSNRYGTASLYNDEGTAVLNNGSGQATVQRYVSPSTSYTGPGYRHYSSPLHSASVAALAVPGQFAPAVNTSYNVLPTPVLPASQFPSVFRYNESRLTAAFPGFDAGWESPASLSETLVPGRGYTVNIPPSATVALTGELNCAAVNTGPLTHGSGPNAGWHLLGNPYPAPLFLGPDFNDSLPTGLARAMYVFEPNSRYGGFYRAFVNGIGTNDDTYLRLSVMQGFFMRTTQDVPAGFTFRTYLRGSDLDSAGFHRQVPGNPRPARPTLRLTLAGSPAQGLDHTVIYLERGATALGTDTRYDAVKLPGPGSLLQLASQMPGPGNEALAINGLPLPGPAIRVLLTLQLATAGRYELRVAALANFDPGTPVTLLDHTTGQAIDLATQPVYGFTTTQAGPLNGRFEVLLGRAGVATATASAAAKSFSIWPNPVLHGTVLRVALDAPAPAATATLTTVLGQMVLQRTFAGATSELATAGLAAGTYLLTVQAVGAVPTTQRVVIE